MNSVQTQPLNVALVVHTCDRYSFLFEGFGYFFKKYWDFNINCKLYFATEELDAAVPGFTNIKSGKGEWADRLHYLLTNVVHEEYVIYMQEDMWLNKAVSAQFMNQLFVLANKNHWKQVKLTSSNVYKTHATDVFIEGFQIARLDNSASGYLMSHQVTLWEGKFLAEQMRKGEHPWRNERKGTKRLKKLNPEIYQVDYFAENGQPAVNNNLPQAAYSEYHTVSANSMLQANTLPYINELNEGTTAERTYANELLRHYQQQLTHDGKAKPRKEDLFKKIKKLFIK
ncbi:hypothetical protein [Mucilaginibacter aquatilis]|uniref:Glycosyl transferase family 2 n=1 Tax=Mucilaginibacter aquatilis TaxID=1517760 RepID=A0A6I4I6I3_9SPHI|nr:hypothetical protein [Mucilaginibacter aquatilis]MVN90701.1 hypothetical protein [Mucilaginibacter aquatilis]